jgi:hypothetical protein
LVKEKKEEQEKRPKEKEIERRNGAAWAGGVIDEGNSVRRVKRN